MAGAQPGGITMQPQTTAATLTQPGMIPAAQTLAGTLAAPKNMDAFAAQGVYGAGAGAAGEMGYQPATIAPSQVSAYGYEAPTIQGVSPITAQNVTAGQIAGTNLAPYMNPYESAVVQQSLSDIERARQMQAAELGAAASAARAFGGSRQGIAEAETNRAFAEQAARTASGLRASGFQQAQQLAGQDIASAMQAALANQAANLQAQTTTGAQGLQTQLANQAALQAAGQFGAGAMSQSALANQQAQMQAALANQQAGLAGSQQRLSAAGTLGQLANLGFGMGTTTKENLRLQAELQRAQEQARIDAARAQAAEAAAAPYKALSTLSAALGGTPMGQTSTTSKQPGLFDYLTLAATAASSDIRLKTDIKRIGTFANGLPMYEWKWNAKAKEIGVENQPTYGVIAQEAREKYPNAVFEGSDGYLRVNYKEMF